MASLFENINIPPCFWFEGEAKRNSIVSSLSGLLFFVGWWLIIDAASVHSGVILAGHHMCGVVGTLSLIMVNSISNAQVRGDSYEEGWLNSRGAKIWLFIGFMIGFASVFASCWLLISFINNGTDKWPGVALFLQNALIFISSITFKFARVEDTWG